MPEPSLLDVFVWSFEITYSSLRGWIGCLLIPAGITTGLAMATRNSGILAAVAVTLAAMILSLCTYLGIGIAEFGVRSTLAIGLFFAMVPIAVVCVTTMVVVRLVLRAKSRG